VSGGESACAANHARRPAQPLPRRRCFRPQSVRKITSPPPGPARSDQLSTQAPQLAIFSS